MGENRMAFLIRGGKPLRGIVQAQGAKNAALPMLFGCLLCDAPVTLYGLPRIGDVSVALSLLTQMGVTVTEKEDGGVVLDAKDAKVPTFALRGCERIRASAYLLGAAAFRFGEGAIPYPGGCAFGVRPLDYHKYAFGAMGITWEETEEGITIKKRKGHKAVYSLPYPSVGATVNFILAALGVAGESILGGYAREHHVLDFVAFLQKMGAKITTAGRYLHVFGGNPLTGGEYIIPPDAIEAGTYLIAAAATGGEVTVKGVRHGELSPLLLALREMRVPYRYAEGQITVYPAKALSGTRITAAPYPGFPTDLHPLMTVLMSRASGGGSVCDLVWGERFLYVDELAKMGLRAVKSPHTVRIFEGSLHGSRVTAPDLRGGAALVVAGLIAAGETTVNGEAFIARGYESFLQKLFSLGADICEI